MMGSHRLIFQITSLPVMRDMRALDGYPFNLLVNGTGAFRTGQRIFQAFFKRGVTVGA